MCAVESLNALPCSCPDWGDGIIFSQNKYRSYKYFWVNRLAMGSTGLESHTQQQGLYV